MQLPLHTNGAEYNNEGPDDLMPINWDLGLALKNSWELGLLSQNQLGFAKMHE